MNESNVTSADYLRAVDKAVTDAFIERLNNTHCRSGCPTQDHASYKDCLKAAHFGVAKGETARGQY